MYKIKYLNKVKKEIDIPADKSISHRAIILSSISEGKVRIKNFLDCDDTRATIDCLKKLGAKIKKRENELIITGVGKYFPRPKKEPLELNANESGTTMRILSGLLCTQKFSLIFKGTKSLKRRPMARIIEPLGKMGANIDGEHRILPQVGTKDIYPPLLISPAKEGIRGIDYQLPVASAQVKSAIMLASLYAEGITKIKEPYQSRDHTERMLKFFGADIKIESDGAIICKRTEKLESPGEIFIPSDFSSASFFIILGLILKETELRIKNVNINPSRCGLLKVLERMGARIEIVNRQDYYEPYADIVVKSSQLKATTVQPDEIPSMIDEIPILCVGAAFAEGKTNIYGLSELRIKETDRLESICSILRAVGVRIITAGMKGIEIEGKGSLHKGSFKSFGDHRTAMSAIVLGSTIGDCFIDDIKCIDKSFPQFIFLIESLQSKK